MVNNNSINNNDEPKENVKYAVLGFKRAMIKDVSKPLSQEVVTVPVPVPL